MTLFEQKYKGVVFQEGTEMLHEREFYVSLIFDPDKLKKRWEEINYTPPIIKPTQLKLFQ